MGRLTILENTKFNPLCRHIILDPSLKALTALCMDVPLRIHQNKSETKPKKTIEKELYYYDQYFQQMMTPYLDFKPKTFSALVFVSNFGHISVSVTNFVLNMQFELKYPLDEI
jgi:hypothetical protein